MTMQTGVAVAVAVAVGAAGVAALALPPRGEPTGVGTGRAGPSRAMHDKGGAAPIPTTTYESDSDRSSESADESSSSCTAAPRGWEGDSSDESNSSSERSNVSAAGPQKKMWSTAQFPEGHTGAYNWDQDNLVAAQQWECPCADRYLLKCVHGGGCTTTMHTTAHTRLHTHTCTHTHAHIITEHTLSTAHIIEPTFLRSLHTHTLLTGTCSNVSPT